MLEEKDADGANEDAEHDAQLQQLEAEHDA